MKFIRELKDMNACTEAIKWVRENNYDMEAAWQNCNRGDWLLWYADKKGVDIKKLTLAKVKCVNMVRHLINDPCGIRALDTAELFANGKASRSQMFDAWQACSQSVDNRHNDYALLSAYMSAILVGNAGWCAYYVACAMDKNSYFTYSVKMMTLFECADICRETLTDEIIKVKK